MIDQMRRMKAVIPDQHKGATVRLATGKGRKTEALCTSTYCYSRSREEQHQMARRIAAMWNLLSDFTTEEIETMKLTKKG